MRDPAYELKIRNGVLPVDDRGVVTFESFTPQQCLLSLTAMSGLQSASMWVVGDVFNHLIEIGSLDESDVADQCDKLDLHRREVRRAMRVSSLWAHDDRRPNLSWTHYKIVAGVRAEGYTEVVTSFLDDAEERDWSAEILRGVVREWKHDVEQQTQQLVEVEIKEARDKDKIWVGEVASEPQVGGGVGSSGPSSPLPEVSTADPAGAYLVKAQQALRVVNREIGSYCQAIHNTTMNDEARALLAQLRTLLGIDR